MTPMYLKILDFDSFCILYFHWDSMKLNGFHIAKFKIYKTDSTFENKFEIAKHNII